MISDSDEEHQSDPGVEANDEEDSTDELNLIGMAMRKNSLQRAMHLTV